MSQLRFCSREISVTSESCNSKGVILIRIEMPYPDGSKQKTSNVNTKGSSLIMFHFVIFVIGLENENTRERERVDL